MTYIFEGRDEVMNEIMIEINQKIKSERRRGKYKIEKLMEDQNDRYKKLWFY